MTANVLQKSSALKLKAVRFSETSAYLYQTTRHYSQKMAIFALTRCWRPHPLAIVAKIQYIVQNKGKVRPIPCHEGPEGEYKYSCTLSLTSALDGDGWSTPRSGRFTPGKETTYPLYRRLGGPQGRFGRLWKISPHWDSIPGPSSP
jgi:hypothetical protein